ncbi:Sterol 3-beta-glucosyltransferase [Saxophila tyrrhenica]|uniref:Sterol 3-beta-glucosyltransferase n=1 Tax=Saxophila tyrrhenica TaxID=1690608 RepID=A0AAV9PA20_9PEZI|nr:Sterol 3-beta-glucosyltransferase [Saxophila tyrrhenica]
MDLPERFKEDDGEEEDASKLDENHPEGFVQQSMYGIIAAAHGKGNFKSSLQRLSGSESESESEDVELGSKAKDKSRVERRTSSEGSDGKATPRPGHRKNKMSESIRSLLKPIRERSDSTAQDPMSQSQLLPPKGTASEEADRPATAIRHDAPIMDQKLQAAARARADFDSSAPSSAKTSREGTPTASMIRKKAPVALPEALADIFQFDVPEEVIAEYSCWYLQSVLLQGYMYITQQHVCFYAYLQKKGNVVKSGHLSKQGKRNPRFRRYWFTLKGDVLSYYASAAEPYFPSGTIDLRFAISAEVVPEKETPQQGKEKENARFVITTDGRTYYFRADSAASAKEWVRQLQKVIFRTRNEGDSVKISIPLENIVDVEANPIVESADTVKLRVIADDDTYAIEEYFFTFFTNGRDALNVLGLMTADNEAKKAATEEGLAEDEGKRSKGRMSSTFKRDQSEERSPRMSTGAALPVAEPVRSTLSPLAAADRSSPRISSDRGRSSGEVSRTSFDRGRSSFDRSRRSLSKTRQTSYQWRRTSKSPLSPSAHESSESFVTSSETALDSPTGEGLDLMSASQVLGGDSVFRGPTMRKPQPKRTVSGSTVGRLRQESREQSPLSPATAPIRVQPPSRAQTEQFLTASPTEVTQQRGEYFSKQKPDNTTAQSSTVQIPVTRPKRALATPLQHAYTLAGVVRDHGKRMSSYLSSSPKDYYNRFSGAIAGGKRHYADSDGLAPDDRIDDIEDDLDTSEHEQRFQQHFALPETERLRAVYYCWLHRVLPLYGKVYLSDRRFCFRSLLYGTRTKLVIPFRDIQNVGKEKGFRWGYPGMVLVIRGHEELFFDFSAAELRDDCAVTVLRALDVTKSALESVMLTEEEQDEAAEAAMENELLQDARRDSYEEDHRKALDAVGGGGIGEMPIMFDDPNASVLDFRPKTSMRITCLTIGSRGDVQPYIALCKGLIAQGHQAKIATHAQFEGWVRKHGVDFSPVNGDPAELMRICVEHGMFTPSFVFETSTYARGWLNELLQTSWTACQNTDLLIESPSAMGGIHIAEALGVPYFRAFGMPWTKTRAYPHAFAVPTSKMGGQFNYMTYVIFENLFWGMTSKQINRWRRKTLSLPPTDLGKMQLNKVPFLYNFSPSVVVPPLDFSDWIRITGYWWLDEADNWTPDKELVEFLGKARSDGAKIVYIGFGSIPVNDTKQLTQQIVDAVLKADVRCVFSKGWSDHFDAQPSSASTAAPAAAALPDSIFQIRSAPHDWLFRQVDAAVHHGGAGTTGASLRAGLPTVIKPFFGDQFFFATRVEDLGVGVNLKKITANSLGKAIWRVCHDERMRGAARHLGEQIRREDGVGNAIKALYRDLEYARTLVKRHGRALEGQEGQEGEEEEESWTFVDDEGDVEVIRGTGELNSYASPSRSTSRHTSLGSLVMRKGV